MPHDTLMILRIQSHMSLLSRLGLIPCVFLGGLKVNPCSVPQASVMSSLRGYATREELLGRLRQAKAYELQEQSGPMHKSMWDDRRTYLLGFSLIGASCWAYSLVSGSSVTDCVYLDIGIGGKPAGRIVLGLHGSSVPRASLNFLELATHRCGYGYRDSTFHEIIPGFAFLGGDITKGDGSGGVAALGPSFTKEKSPIKHGRGTLSMVVDLEGAVRSQFFICRSPSPALNHQMVAFGTVLEGLELVDHICSLPVDPHGRPLQSISITDCGELPVSSTQANGDGSFLSGLLKRWLYGEAGTSAS